MEKAITETKERTPEEKILIAIIQQTMEDAFELSGSTNLTMAEIQQSRNWFYTKACSIICDHLGTTRDHVLKLYNKLSDKYKTGQVTKDQLRFAIRRLELKL
jgi:predicted restriction endonuclease|tara:strand:- start:379 stop:684 length:306 start_codon:yes stop_codon:yes gene_type:complete